MSGRILLIFLVIASVAAAACSGSPQRLSPTAPSAAVASPGGAVLSDPDGSAGEPGSDAVSGTTSVDRGQTAGVVSDAAIVEAWAERQPGWSAAADNPTALEVEGTGPITAVSGACPDVVLTIYGIPVTVNAGTLFGPGTTCASLTVGTVVRVRGLLIITGGAMSVVAVQVAVEDDRVVEGEGRVLAVSGTCPALTLSVDGITVVTDTQTTFLPPVGCAEIRVGTKVRVRGVPVAGSANFRALSVAITGQRHSFEGEGRIVRVTGTCPDLTLTLEHGEVQVNAQTVYRGGTCASLQPGVKIEARGHRDDGGPLVATFVEIRARHVEGEGTVASLTGSCPNLQMVIHGLRVVTNSSTVFRDGACGNIRVGTKVEIKGDQLTADGAVIAEEVEIEDQPGRGGVIEGEGTIGTATGACPTRSMVVQGYSVMTGAETIFRNGSCANLTSGRRIFARGETRGNSIFALEVEFR